MKAFRLPAAKPKAPVSRRAPLFAKGSRMAKSPFGQLVELLRDVPADQIKPWPLCACPLCQ